MTDAGITLTAEGVYLARGRTYVLRNLCLRLRSGDVVGLVGENGAGKTTLLAVLASRLRPTRGRVTLRSAGRLLRGQEYRATVGMVAHEPFLYPELTCRENLALFAALYGQDSSRNALEGILQTVGLSGAVERPVGLLSRGMTQRLAIARLLVSASKVWLLDEPFSGLDLEGQAFLDRLLRAHGESGGIVVVSSHTPNLLDGLCNRTIRLRKGRLVPSQEAEAPR